MDIGEPDAAPPPQRAILTQERPVIYAKLEPNAPRRYRYIRFWDVAEPSDPTKLSMTKLNLALSTLFTAVTGAAAAFQHFISTAAHTDWAWIAGAVTWHGVSQGAHGWKRYVEK